MSTLIARLLAVGLIWLATASAASALEGVFVGLDDASGSTLRLSPPKGGSQKGQFTDRGGNTAVFNGEVFPDGVEATFPIGDVRLYLRAIEHPSGAIVVIVPIAPDGTQRADLTRSFGYVREGSPTEVDRPYFVGEPTRQGASVDAASFVQSYEFWSPDGVGRGYVSVLPRYRSVIALFPTLQTDIIWKLCSQQVGAAPGLAEALRGQGVTCSDVLGAIAQSKSRGRYAKFLGQVAAERQIAFEQISCARRIGTKRRCEEVAKLVSEIAISMENAATVIARYR